MGLISADEPLPSTKLDHARNEAAARAGAGARGAEVVLAAAIAEATAEAIAIAVDAVRAGSETPKGEHEGHEGNRRGHDCLTSCVDCVPFVFALRPGSMHHHCPSLLLWRPHQEDQRRHAQKDNSQHQNASLNDMIAACCRIMFSIIPLAMR